MTRPASEGAAYLPKPFEIDALVVALRRAVQHRARRAEVTRLQRALGGNKTVAAKILDIDRTTLYRKLERYGLSEPPPRT